MKEPKTPQQVLDQSREECKKNFWIDLDKPFPCVMYVDRTALPDDILSLHTSTLQAFIGAEIERLEKQKGMIKNPEFYTKLKRIMKGNIVMKGMDDITFTQIAWEAKDTLLDDQISHLKELLKR